MQIDYALILSAGMGSRMGEIGKKLPKPLWPIFTKTLLELQIDYCRELGVNKIYLNAHFLADEIKNFIKGNEKFTDVKVLEEEQLLGSGGAVHNFAAQKEINYKGNLLYVNADQFLFFENVLFQRALKELENSRATLFGIQVPKDSKYNETIIKDGQLVQIVAPPRPADYVTYSGLGLIKLDQLMPALGNTNFFETVANYKHERVSFITLNNIEYWDFGTAEIYLKNIANLYSLVKSKDIGMGVSFFKRNGCFNMNEDNFYSIELNSVSLQGVSDFENNSVVGFGITQKI